MRFGFLIVALLLFSTSSTIGQQRQAQELQAQLELAEGQQRVDLLNELTELLMTTDPRQAEKYADEAYKESQDLNYQQGTMASGFNLGILQRDKNNPRRAVRFTKSGISIAQSLQDQQAELHGLNILRTIYMKWGKTQELEEVSLEYQRLSNNMQLQKRNQEVNIQNEEYQKKEQALEQALEQSEATNTRIASEKQQMQEEMQQLELEKLREKARLDSLEKETVELELETVKTQNQILEYNARLERQQTIQWLLIGGIIIALIFIGILWLYFRLRRLRQAEKLKTQRQLMMQQKMAALGQLTAGMAHEIQNPLNFVNNFAEGSSEIAKELEETLMAYRKKPQAKDLDYCQELATDLRQNAADIQKNGQRINRIVRSMMEHARGNTGKIEPTDLNALVQQNLNLAYHGFRGLHPSFTATIEEHYDKRIGKIEVIPQDLSRVFLNIFGNACYALNEKLQSAPTDYAPTLRTATQSQNGNVIVTIWDNGGGIPESIQKEIFTPFFTTKSTDEAHTGLGLSISYDIVVQGHQGKLEVRSQPGQFTEFSVILPA